MSDELRQDDIDALLNQEEPKEEPKEETPQAETQAEDKAGQEATQPDLGDAEADLLAQWEEALQEAKETGSTSSEAEDTQKSAKEQPEASQPDFEEFKPGGNETEGHPNLEFILDIPLEISVEIGRTKMIINDLLKLSQGSIIELNKLAGEPAEIYVNKRLMARGEVVVVNDRFAVRLTEIISPQERVRQLGS
ncbi:flagellar motor switch protein FliN [Thermodesulfatator indicus DSM 15286]|uniref:Flagellar motor switch protein FliN n=1 Tax=Thermodesulfatator indicus (strain DSM 15286 / JCM 11887 / CIR29812) TaxID=667014 RepID=F8A9C5_THEID|nr:flagellar motor switch protein FliN [Thermodesulfatator indicus]AEH44066.1 flagellar motor switch protein FliN [Thermodesulfatator indicus DSM 15286]